MHADNLKIGCTLEGDNAIDFERLSMVFKMPSRAPTKQKQQALMIGASLLALDAAMRKYSEETGKRYPSLEEVLMFAGCRPPDVDKLLNGSPAAGVDALKGAIERQSSRKK